MKKRLNVGSDPGHLMSKIFAAFDQHMKRTKCM